MIFLYKDTTPALGVAPPSPLERLPVTYGINSLTLNSPNDPIDETFELVDAVTVPMSNSVTEVKQGKDGSEGYQTFKSGWTIRLNGYVKSKTLAGLAARMHTLAYEFDPANLSRRTALSTIGYYPLSFSVPTSDTANYPSGLVPSFVYARAIAPVSFGRTKYDGYAIPFRIDMHVRDPRRYFATLQQASISGGVISMQNSAASYHSWPKTYITMSGAGAANATLTQTTVIFSPQALVLDLSSLTAGQVVIIDHERKMISIAGVPRMDLFVSGNYHAVEAGGSGVTTVTLTNGSGISTVRYDWYRAFVI